MTYFETEARDVATGNPLLFYNGRCPRCRALSRLVVWSSLGEIRRLSLDSAQAEAFYRRHPAARGRLALRHRGRLTCGRRVFLAVPWVVLRGWWGQRNIFSRILGTFRSLPSLPR